LELRDAISQISQIRAQMARGERLRGLRAVPVGFSGLMALAAAALQPALVPQPASQLDAYLLLWLGVAVLSAATGFLEMAVRCRVSGSGLTRATVFLAAEQFLPCLFAGAAVTFVLIRTAPEQAWLLPGLWQILFGLGVFAFARLLPRPVFWVAAYYLMTGTGVLALGPEALSGWAMGLPFGFGQLMTAAILYWTLERPDPRPIRSALEDER